MGQAKGIAKVVGIAALSVVLSVYLVFLGCVSQLLFILFLTWLQNG